MRRLSPQLFDVCLAVEQGSKAPAPKLSPRSSTERIELFLDQRLIQAEKQG